ncbi:MAG: hypothetical protein ACKOVB_24560, partial [Terrabacter sp.]
MSGDRPALPALTVAVLAAALLGGCGAGAPHTTATGGSVQTPTPSSSDQAANQPTNQATNPVWPSNFPDPQILRDGDGWVAIATNGNGMNVQTLVSHDLVTWTQGSDALPQLPAWTTKG